MRHDPERKHKSKGAKKIALDPETQMRQQYEVMVARQAAEFATQILLRQGEIDYLTKQNNRLEKRLRGKERVIERLNQMLASVIVEQKYPRFAQFIQVICNLPLIGSRLDRYLSDEGKTYYYQHQRKYFDSEN